MNELATIDHREVLPAFSEWVQAGRNIVDKRRQINWGIADWVMFGSNHFPEQMKLALTDVDEDPRTLQRAEKVARAFPAHLRVASLSFDHHAHLADLPTQEALPLLADAAKEKLSAKQLKVRATMRKIALSGQAPFKDDDVDYTELMSIVRAWNSAQPHIRKEFIEMATNAKTGIIEA
jgi:hypothetical protein